MSNLKRCAALIYGAHSHHLDHLAPLCQLLKIPLLLTEPSIGKDTSMYYPAVEVICLDPFCLPEYLVSSFEVIFYSFPRDLFDELFFLPQKMLQKTIYTIWCPHGNSDKGQTIFYMEALRREKAALVYGKQMIDYLKRKEAFAQLKDHVILGNYRYETYLASKRFYDELCEDQIVGRFSQDLPIILYAPTWRDYEQSSSFFDALPHLVEHLPKDKNLLIKLHPNLRLQEEGLIETLILRYQDHPRLVFITDFFPIYPLLHRAWIYLGDMSSVGYDFLTFNRPLFFLNQNKKDSSLDSGLYLFRCGIQIHQEDYARIYQVIENFFLFETRCFATLRQEVYTYAFGHQKPLPKVRDEIELMVNALSR